MQMHRPKLAPWSQTPAPYIEWQKERSKGFSTETVLDSCGIGATSSRFALSADTVLTQNQKASNHSQSKAATV